MDELERTGPTTGEREVTAGRTATSGTAAVRTAVPGAAASPAANAPAQEPEREPSQKADLQPAEEAGRDLAFSSESAAPFTLPSSPAELPWLVDAGAMPCDDRDGEASDLAATELVVVTGGAAAPGEEPAAQPPQDSTPAEPSEAQGQAELPEVPRQAEPPEESRQAEPPEAPWEGETLEGSWPPEPEYLMEPAELEEPVPSTEILTTPFPAPPPISEPPPVREAPADLPVAPMVLLPPPARPVPRLLAPPLPPLPVIDDSPDRQPDRLHDARPILARAPPAATMLPASTEFPAFSPPSSLPSTEVPRPPSRELGEPGVLPLPEPPPAAAAHPLAAPMADALARDVHLPGNDRFLAELRAEPRMAAETSLQADPSYAPDVPRDAGWPSWSWYTPWLRRALFYGAMAFGLWMLSVLGQIVLYRYVDPPTSNLMLATRLSGEVVVQRWLPVEKMPAQLIRAIVVSEDGRFCSHRGIDLKELEKAIERSKDGTPRGASTITMQVAKNMFLWPSKSYIRKGLEVPITLAMEALWSKRRIFEIYANIAEWAPGVFGVEAAAGYHFGKTASRVTEREAALLAVALPNPLTRDAGDPGPGTERLANIIQTRMRAMSRAASCIERGRS